MAFSKRKAVVDDRPAKKARVAQEEKKDNPKKPTKPNDAPAGERKPAAKSVLLQEEKSFPRGGASVLTPIEHKQIRAQAERDVLFEQRTGQTSSKTAEDDEELFDQGEQARETPVKKRRRVQDSKPRKEQERKDNSSVKIQGLSYKNLVSGSIVLGRVTSITGKDLALALPNNLTGFVPITSISDTLNKRIESLLNDDAENEDKEDDDGDVELEKLFYIGQWLRAAVASTAPESSEGRSKRHIGLHLDPRQVNSQLEPESVVVNSMIQASVRSVEDHGVVMDLGLANKTIKGFVSKKELGATQKLDDIEVGQVMLCLVTGKGSDGKVLKLSPDAAKFSSLVSGKQAPVVSDAPTVDAFLPGTAVDVLITDTGASGLVGKIMGLVDVTADIIHSGAGSLSSEGFAKKYKVGSKSKARVTWVIPGDDGSRSIGVSLLEHVLAMPPPPDKVPLTANTKMRDFSVRSEQHIPSSTIIDEATITAVLPERGVFISIPATDEKMGDDTGFAHISQLSDSRTDTLTPSTGTYKVNSTHRVRVMAYNPIDGLFYLSLKESVLSQKFLRLEDLQVGENVEGKVDRLLLGGSQGVKGILVKLTDNITAYVPDIHMSDIALQHPERKFREGFTVKGRVLNTDVDKRQVRLTLKKTLLHDDSKDIWKDYKDLAVGQESKGTIVKLLDKGAVVQFYGPVRAFLPVSEMSDAYVESPAKHFRLGQTVIARILQINPEAEEMRVSCKAAGGMDEQTQQAWDAIEPGQILAASITAILGDKVELELEGGVKGAIRVGHLSDGSASKTETALKRLRVGQKFNELVVLTKSERNNLISLTLKASIVTDAKAGKVVKGLGDASPGRKVRGFVRNITPEGVYVEFINSTVALLPKSQVPPELAVQPAFGLRKDQTITAWVLNVDEGRQRFAVTMRESSANQTPATGSNATGSDVPAQTMDNPIDTSLSTTADLTLNRVTKAKIASIKSTQLNVRLSDGVHGRVDVSEVFDAWDQIKNAKAPFRDYFKVNQVIDVKVLGIRDARGWRFLPFSHRGRGNAVVELSAKRSRIDEESSKLLGGLTEVQKGEKYIGFINSISEDCVWVNLSPGIRGRVALMDLSDDVGLLQDLGKSFPPGSALQVRIKNVLPGANRLDLTARLTEQGDAAISLETLKPGEVVPGRVTKVSERAVTVQLSEGLAGPVPLVELSDDFDNADPTRYSKNDIVRVRVLSVDHPNKKLYLSLRPSLALSSSLPVKDVQIPDLTHLKPGLIVRGFVKHVGEKGVLVSLSGTVDAFVRVADLSDAYIKEWRDFLQIDQLVRGRVIAVDEVSKHIQLSLKASHVDENYKPPLKLDDLKVGVVVTGKVRKVEDFGVFVDIDGTLPRLSGLAHRSEIAERRVADVRGLYSEGDKVKAKILKVDVNARKISLGLKASYFKDDDDDDDDDEIEAEDDDVVMDDDDASGSGIVIAGHDVDEEGGDVEGGLELDVVEDMNEELVDEEDEELEGSVSEDESGAPPIAGSGLKTAGFDWTGNSLDAAANGTTYDSEPEIATKKRKRTKPQIKVDLTGDLDRYGPQSSSDFERQLLGQPNDSSLWIQYMAFQLQLSEMQKAREIAERALRTIHMRDLDEKANVWIAWINLEVEYGSDERVEEVFKRACQVQEPLGMHEKLASIYIDSGKHDKADGVFEQMVGNKAFRASPDVWLNYATFLINTLKEPARARALLSRALQSIPQSEHRLLTAKFAALEFRAEAGDPERGRTIFEGLVSEWPKWATAWDMWVDIERSRVEKGEDKDARKGAIERVRSLYERSTQAGMKKRRAKFVFKRWLEFEEKMGDDKGQERVKALAKEFVEKLLAKDADDGEE